MTTAFVFDVQRFSVHDGPGIRTTVFFKGCPLSCAWCQNPESIRREPELAWYASRCRQTGHCLSACPRGALQAGESRVDRERCDLCGECVSDCPYGAYAVIGREVTVDELLEEVCRDFPFHRATGGGVTLSGGEPTLQMPFLAEFLPRIRQAGVTVGLQTCGVFAWKDLEPQLEAIDFVHFDLKLMDSDLHQRFTGGGNRRILDNARRLIDRCDVSFRMPVVPSVNDGRENLQAVAAFLRAVGSPRIHLLPYHRLGEAKRAALGRMEQGIPVDPARDGFAAARATLVASGVEVTT